MGQSLLHGPNHLANVSYHSWIANDPLSWKTREGAEKERAEVFLNFLTI